MHRVANQSISEKSPLSVIPTHLQPDHARGVSTMSPFDVDGLRGDAANSPPPQTSATATTPSTEPLPSPSHVRFSTAMYVNQISRVDLAGAPSEKPTQAKWSLSNVPPSAATKTATEAATKPTPYTFSGLKRPTANASPVSFPVEGVIKVRREKPEGEPLWGTSAREGG